MIFLDKKVDIMFAYIENNILCYLFISNVQC
jgi:hypothetical protein